MKSWFMAGSHPQDYEAQNYEVVLHVPLDLSAEQGNLCVVIPLNGKAFHKFAVRGILSKYIA